MGSAGRRKGLEGAFQVEKELSGGRLIWLGAVQRRELGFAAVGSVVYNPQDHKEGTVYDASMGEGGVANMMCWYYEED